MRILWAITGASGIAYSRRLAEVLRAGKHTVAVVASEGAKKVAEADTGQKP